MHVCIYIYICIYIHTYIKDRIHMYHVQMDHNCGDSPMTLPGEDNLMMQFDTLNEAPLVEIWANPAG